jgi:uncharacterized membrane protein YgdD (TMEM256/DUF423 family)
VTASRIHLALAALMGGAGVILWSMAAHAPAGPTLATAAQMLLIHAGGVCGITACRKQGLIHDKFASLGVTLLLLGVALFAADRALRSMVGQRLFPGAAPLGGLLMIGGWLGVAGAALIRAKL